VALAHVVMDLGRSILVGHVDRHAADPLGAERVGQRAQPLLAARHQDQRAVRLAGNAPRGRLPDPARGSRDHRDEPSAHDMLSLDDRVLAVPRLPSTPAKAFSG